MVEDLVRSVEARLLIIDPIVAAIVTELDAHKDQHVRAVLALLAELAEEADCAVAIVGRLNKAPTTDPCGWRTRSRSGTRPGRSCS